MSALRALLHERLELAAAAIAAHNQDAILSRTTRTRLSHALSLSRHPPGFDLVVIHGLTDASSSLRSSRAWWS